MQHDTDHHDVTSRLFHLTEELSAGCDSEFDTGHEEMEREFAEIRLQLGSHS